MLAHCGIEEGMDEEVVGTHTPGPWVWHESPMWGGKSGLFNGDGDPVCVPSTSNDGDTGAAWFDDMLSEADARLMVASPDLLEACKAFVEAESADEMSAAYTMSLHAIRKATEGEDVQA
jgi:hypothetical protein